MMVGLCLERLMADDPTKMQFAFKPHKSWHTGKHTLRVVGTDAGIGGDPDTKKSDFAEFVLEVLDFNDAPKLRAVWPRTRFRRT